MSRSVTVVGGGITGAFAAYFLAMSGNVVTVIDPEEDQCRASTNNPGGINPLHGPGIPGVMSRFALRCHQLHLAQWRKISKVVSTDFKGRVICRLFLAFTADEAALLQDMAKLYQAAEGFSAEWLGGNELRKLDERIGEKVIGGLCAQGNATVDSAAYNSAVLEAACRWGARKISGRVTGVVSHGDRVKELRTVSGRLCCDEIVFATGAWVEWFCEDLDVRIPVRPVRGELLLAELGLDAPSHDITWNRYGVYHHSNATFWLGGTFDEAGFEGAPTREGKQRIQEGVCTMLPSLAGCRLLRQVAGLRPMTPDGMPIIDRIPGLVNAWVVLGGGSKGILLSSGLGKAIAGMIEGSPGVEDDLSFLSLSRFIENDASASSRSR